MERPFNCRFHAVRLGVVLQTLDFLKVSCLSITVNAVLQISSACDDQLFSVYAGGASVNDHCRTVAVVLVSLENLVGIPVSCIYDLRNTSFVRCDTGHQQCT